MWARPQPKNSGACLSGPQGAVRNAEWADDLLYISGEPPWISQSALVLTEPSCPVFLTAPAQISCFSGTNSNATNASSSGVHELTVSLSSGSVGCSVGPACYQV